MRHKALPANYLLHSIQTTLSDAGFEVSKENNRRDFTLDFFKQLRVKTQAIGGPPSPGLDTLMRESTTIKITNMMDNIANGYIAPIEIVAKKA